MPPKKRPKQDGARATAATDDDAGRQSQRVHCSLLDASGAAPPQRVVLLDCGGAFIKAAKMERRGSSGLQLTAVAVAPNAIGVRPASVADAAPSPMETLVGSALMALSSYRRLFLRRPIQRGLLADAALQATIWAHVFGELGLDAAELGDVDIVVTVCPATPPQVAALWHQLCVERFAFSSVTFVTSAFLAQFSCCRERQPTGAAAVLVVDCGFSHTLVTPFIGHRPVRSATRRLDVGGKLLTNRFKEVLSFTQLNVLDETWMINAIKECVFEVCATDFISDALPALETRELVREGPAPGATSSPSSQPHVSLRGRQQKHAAALLLANAGGGSDDDDDDEEKQHDGGADDVAVPGKSSAMSSLRRQRRYILPTCPELQPLGYPVDESPQRRGSSGGWKAKFSFVAGGPQTLVMRHEHFVVPEALFTPADVGLAQSGLAELAEGACREAAAATAGGDAVFDALAAAVVVVGGTANIPGLPERVASHVTSIQRADAPLRGSSDTHPTPSADLLRIVAETFAGSKGAKSLALLHGAFRQHRVDAFGAALSTERIQQELLRLLAPLLGGVRLLLLADGDDRSIIDDVRGLLAASRVVIGGEDAVEVAAIEAAIEVAP